MKDRRIQKSQESIKNAFIELMSEKDFEHITIQDISNKANVGRRTFYHHYVDKYDLLSRLIKDHINELRIICQSSVNVNENQPSGVWFDYFERNYQFFAIMLVGKGQFAFRTLFLEFVIEELKRTVDISNGINKGLNEEIYFTFFGSAIVGIIESYFTQNVPESSSALAEQVMILLDRNI